VASGLHGAAAVGFLGTPAAHACTTTSWLSPTSATAAAPDLLGEALSQPARGSGALVLADEWTPEATVVSTGFGVVALRAAGGLALNEFQSRAVERRIAFDSLADAVAMREGDRAGRESCPDRRAVRQGRAASTTRQ
jgi:hypothetical protein